MQATLFGRGEAEVAGFGRAVHTDLGAGAWVEHVPGFVHGQDGLFDAIRRGTGWVSQRRRMYERVVDVPRLLGRPPDLPVLAGAVDALEGRYGWRLDRVSAALYRDGRDSVAWHGDRMGDLRADCVIAVLCLGSERRFLLRPAGGGPSRAIRFMGGDLIVMGGTAQETWEHCVPKRADAGPRIAVMFRPSARPG
ncbi:MAG: alpha-ketoglutarate-dependent dioxygenase AlkB [Myxococcales bacterium]|nr:alpha-ketoglutarate-dependent dioxygenase AlkB [Myxococcales bacterium]